MKETTKKTIGFFNETDPKSLEKTKKLFKKALKNSGVNYSVELTPRYENNSFSLVSVSDEETAKKFIEEAEKLNLSAKARNYGDSETIWFFYAYFK